MRALAAGLLLLAPLPGFAAEPPLCRAEVSVEPARAFVGQPVLHRVRVHQRREVVDLRWETSLSFPAFRAERLLGPGGPREQSATHETIEERRVLFPARAGRLTLPAARVACESADRVETAEVPAAELIAEEPPAEGRPPGWAGLIGPVALSVYATPDRVALGESISLAVTVEGETNVWAAPVAFSFPPDVAELFERPSELARDMGRTLRLRGYRSFDLVPRRSGTLEIPALRVAWFDPHARRYGESRAPALRVEVSERRPAAQAVAPKAEEPARGQPHRLWLSATAALLALGGGLAAGFWLGRRPRERRPPGLRSADERVGAAALPAAREAIRTAIARSDGSAAAAAAARLLRLEIERTLPGARARDVQELAATAPPALADAVALLARLEDARFGGAEPAALLALAREAERRGREAERRGR